MRFIVKVDTDYSDVEKVKQKFDDAKFFQGVDRVVYLENPGGGTYVETFSD